MKREYVAPQMEQMQMDEELPLCGSVKSSSNGIGYGGVDVDGILDPAANERLDLEKEISEWLW
jgi:hypothetical protein